MKHVVITIDACVSDGWTLDIDKLKQDTQLPMGMLLIDANAEYSDDDQPCNEQPS